MMAAKAPRQYPGPRLPRRTQGAERVLRHKPGTGAATAVAPASRRCSALFTFLRIDEPAYRPAAYRANRAQDAEASVSRIRDAGGRGRAIIGTSSSAARQAQEAVW